MTFNENCMDFTNLAKSHYLILLLFIPETKRLQRRLGEYGVIRQLYFGKLSCCLYLICAKKVIINLYFSRYNLQLSILDPEAVEHPLPCTCDLTKCLLIKSYMLQHPEESEKNAMETNGIEEEAIDDDDDMDSENDDS